MPFNEVRIVDRGAVTAHTTGRLRSPDRCGPGCRGWLKSAGDTAVTVRTVTGCRTGQLGGVVVTGVATVVCEVAVDAVNEVRIVDRGAVTAHTTGRLR